MNSFSYETIFAQSSPTTGQKQSDVEFYGKSYGAQDVTGFDWVQKFLYEKPRKSRKNHEYSRISDKISAFFCTSEYVPSYGYVKTKISMQRKNFEKSSEFSLSMSKEGRFYIILRGIWLYFVEDGSIWIQMSSGKRPFINKLYLLGFVCLNLGICFAVVGWSDSVFSLGAALCYGGLFTVRT